MATKKIQDLENVEEVLADSIIPVGEATKTKSMLVSQLKNWLSSFFVNNIGDEDIEGVKNFLNKIKTITPPSASNDKTIPNTEWVNSIILASMPIGTILPYGGSTAPKGFLLCNGATINRTTYANLFKAIGTTYGAGDGSTTFKIPSASNIVTSVNTSVPIKGDGKTIGLTNGSTNHGTIQTPDGIWTSSTAGYGGNVGTAVGGANHSDILIGLTTDSSKSGIVGTVARGSFTCKFIIKY